MPMVQFLTLQPMIIKQNSMHGIVTTMWAVQPRNWFDPSHNKEIFLIPKMSRPALESKHLSVQQVLGSFPRGQMAVM